MLLAGNGEIRSTLKDNVVDAAMIPAQLILTVAFVGTIYFSKNRYSRTAARYALLFSAHGLALFILRNTGYPLQDVLAWLTDALVSLGLLTAVVSMWLTHLNLPFRNAAIRTELERVGIPSRITLMDALSETRYPLAITQLLLSGIALTNVLLSLDLLGQIFDFRQALCTLAAAFITGNLIAWLIRHSKQVMNGSR
jgi:hypothetical protein